MFLIKGATGVFFASLGLPLDEHKSTGQETRGNIGVFPGAAPEEGGGAENQTLE
jgi:hypothetical protein